MAWFWWVLPIVGLTICVLFAVVMIRGICGGHFMCMGRHGREADETSALRREVRELREELKRVSKAVVLILGLTLVFGVATAHGQSVSAPADPHHPATVTPAPSPGGMTEPSGSNMPMMDMCRQMMAGPMMMGMAGDQKMDPKTMAQMLQMRGEMMKAMGEVMMKHGKMMGGGESK
jgi:hypothetical protein